MGVVRLGCGVCGRGGGGVGWGGGSLQTANFGAGAGGLKQGWVRQQAVVPTRCGPHPTTCAPRSGRARRPWVHPPGAAAAPRLPPPGNGGSGPGPPPRPQGIGEPGPGCSGRWHTPGPAHGRARPRCLQGTRGGGEGGGGLRSSGAGGGECLNSVWAVVVPVRVVPLVLRGDGRAPRGSAVPGVACCACCRCQAVLRTRG